MQIWSWLGMSQLHQEFTICGPQFLRGTQSLEGQYIHMSTVCKLNKNVLAHTAATFLNAFFAVNKMHYFFQKHYWILNSPGITYFLKDTKPIVWEFSFFLKFCCFWGSCPCWTIDIYLLIFIEHILWVSHYWCSCEHHRQKFLSGTLILAEEIKIYK